MVDPDPGLSSEVGAGGYHAGFALRVTIFGELKDARVVKRVHVLPEPIWDC